MQSEKIYNNRKIPDFFYFKSKKKQKTTKKFTKVVKFQHKNRYLNKQNHLKYSQSSILKLKSMSLKKFIDGVNFKEIIWSLIMGLIFPAILLYKSFYENDGIILKHSISFSKLKTDNNHNLHKDSLSIVRAKNK